MNQDQQEIMRKALGSKGDGEDGDMYVNIYVYVHMNEYIHEKQQ